MAPPITHFLVGAAIVLVVATPFAMHRQLHPAMPLWLVLFGGMWGLLPDVYHVAPIYVDEVRQFHHSPWADLFAFHYTLDRPFVRRRHYQSIIGAIIAFGAAITIFTVGVATEPREMSRAATGTAAVLAAVVVLVVVGSPFIGGMSEAVTIFLN